MQAKYSALIEERSAFQYTLYDGGFEVGALPIPPTQGAHFLFYFVWSEKRASIPRCDEEKARPPACGACYVSLDSNWYMYWRWFPRDLGLDWDGRIGGGLLTPEEAHEQYAIALDECIAAGREEMGMDSGPE